MKTDKSSGQNQQDNANSAKIWLNITKYCNIALGLTMVLLCVLAGIFSGSKAIFSVLFSWIIVAGFFSISMLVVHYFWLRKPEFAMPAAMFTFIFKIIILGVVLLVVTPLLDLDKTWFLISALVFVVLWQIIEIIVALRSKVFIYDIAGQNKEVNGQKTK